MRRFHSSDEDQTTRKSEAGHAARAAPKRGKRLVLVSVDGLSVCEWERLRSLPHFSALLARGVHSRSLRSVFPSLTYVIHTTMTTGRHPEVHGVVHNRHLQPGLHTDRQSWYWYADEVGVPTLFDLARKAGLRSAAVLWPLAAKGAIDWNFPEIAALPGENQLAKMLRAGSPLYLIVLQFLFGKYRKGSAQPALDDFVSRSAAWTLAKCKPDLLLTHLISLDSAKHEYGSDSPEAARALVFLDEALGRIVAAIRESGFGEETCLVVLGDHGHIDTTRRVRLNLLIERAGLCGRSGERNGKGSNEGGDGEFPWRAWFRCSGGSACLHVRKGDVEARESALDLLREIADDSALGVETIYDREALSGLHADPEALAGFEARPGIQFVEDRDGPLTEDSPVPGAFGADHGYHPDKADYRTLFFAAGPGLRRDGEIGPMEMTDIAPILARILGLTFDAVDGEVPEGIFMGT